MLRGVLRWARRLGGLAAFAFALATGAGAYAACCNVPTTHQVRIPGVVVGLPTQGCTTNCGGPPPCGACNTPPPSCNTCGGQAQFNGSLSVTATANAAAATSTNAFANSAAYNLANAIGGGGGSSYFVDYNSGYISGLNVDSGAAAVNTAYSATRTAIKVVVIRAVCLDDREIPHPASQVSPDKEIGDAYEGELFRCLAGTRMQYTFAEYKGKVSFDNGQTVTCDKGHALYHAAGGKLDCRPQKPARDCNERSLLRRFGAGIKIVKIVLTETYTAYRTEYREQASASVAGMAIDGGVGGIVH